MYGDGDTNNIYGKEKCINGNDEFNNDDAAYSINDNYGNEKMMTMTMDIINNKVTNKYDSSIKYHKYHLL